MSIAVKSSTNKVISNDICLLHCWFMDLKLNRLAKASGFNLDLT